MNGFTWLKIFSNKIESSSLAGIGKIDNEDTPTQEKGTKVDVEYC